MRFEIEMNGTMYAFNFGMGFLKAINSRATEKVPNSNYSVNVGAKYLMAQVMSDDVEALCDVLMTANKGETPRLTQKELETYIEDEATDIEALFEQVVDFFGKANATKMIYKELKELTDENEKK
jgi:DNA-binding ferritin-like protein (Dps family)